MKLEDDSEFQSRLTAALNAIADLAGDAAPTVEDLALLVAQVRRDQRRQMVRDLALFWGCAVIILAVLIGGAARSLSLFLGIQAVVAVLLLGGAAVWSAVRKGAS